MRTLIPHLSVGSSQLVITRKNSKEHEQHTVTSLLGRLPWDLLGLFLTLRYFTCIGNYVCLYSSTDLLLNCFHDRLNHSRKLLMFPDRYRILEPPDRLSQRCWVLQPPDRYWVLQPSPPATNRKLIDWRLTALSGIRKFILGIFNDLSVFEELSYHLFRLKKKQNPITWAK